MVIEDRFVGGSGHALSLTLAAAGAGMPRTTTPPACHLELADGPSAGGAPLDEPRYSVFMDGEKRRSLTEAFIKDTLDVLPVRPEAVDHVRGPLLQISRVPGNDSAVDVRVMHHFRAHFRESGSPHLLLSAHASPSVSADAEVAAAGASTCRLQQQQEPGAGGGRETPDCDGQQQPPTPTSPAAQASPSAPGRPAITEIDSSSRSSSAGGSSSSAGCSEHAVDAPAGPYSAGGAGPGEPGRELAQVRQALAPAAPAGRRQAAAQQRCSNLWEIDPAEVVVGERLAVGGFAEVFLGKYQGTLVAVKLLLNVDAAGRRRFLSEVQLLASLRHPNILLFMGYSLHPYLAIITEFMHRGSLFKLLHKGGNRPLEPRLARAAALSVARGMAYLASRQPPLVHLDLKSANVLVDDKFRFKIADFGLSRVRSSSYVSSTAPAGTAQWMAPEILRSEQFTEAADVYSYGIILWECLTGRIPWEGMLAVQVVGAVGFQHCTLPRPEEGEPVLVDLCMRCMSQRPSDRPAFAQVVAELEQAFGPPSLASSLHSTLSDRTVQLDSSSTEGGEGMARELPPLLPPAAAALEPAAAGGPGSAQGLSPFGAATAQGLLEGDAEGVPAAWRGSADASPFAAAQPIIEEPPSSDGIPGGSGRSDPRLPPVPLHPADSITNASPFAFLQQRALSSQPSAPRTGGRDGCSRSWERAEEEQQVPHSRTSILDQQTGSARSSCASQDAGVAAALHVALRLGPPKTAADEAPQAAPPAAAQGHARRQASLRPACSLSAINQALGSELQQQMGFRHEHSLALPAADA